MPSAVSEGQSFSERRTKSDHTAEIYKISILRSDRCETFENLSLKQGSTFFSTREIQSKFQVDFFAAIRPASTLLFVISPFYTYTGEQKNFFSQREEPKICPRAQYPRWPLNHRAQQSLQRETLAMSSATRVNRVEEP
jgi:hypothetical protein